MVVNKSCPEGGEYGRPPRSHVLWGPKFHGSYSVYVLELNLYTRSLVVFINIENIFVFLIILLMIFLSVVQVFEILIIYMTLKRVFFLLARPKNCLDRPTGKGWCFDFKV